MPPDRPYRRGLILISGASTGIGRVTALHLARKGFQVLAGVRRDEDAQSLEAEGGGYAQAGLLKAIRLDVTDAASIASTAETTKQYAGTDGLLGLVNNAGVGVLGPVECVPLDDWRRQFEINLFGSIALTQACLPLLRQRVARHGNGKARIVLMSSIAGRLGQPVLGPYCASKFALEAVGDALRIELHRQHIRVCLIEPGAIATPIWQKGQATAADVNSSPLRPLYEKEIDAVLKLAKKSASGAIPPQAVANVVERCLTATRPRPRTFVGRDAKVVGFLRKILPDTLIDAAILKTLRIK